MKVTIFCLVLLASAAFSQLSLPTEVSVFDENLTIDRKQALSFLGGLAEGVAQGLHFEDFSHCINDDKAIAQHILAAIKLFQQKGAKDIAQAIAELAAAAKNIPQAIKDCKAAVHDIHTLIQLIEEFTNPGKFVWIVGKNLIIHGVEIYHHVKSGVQNFKDSQFHESGFQFGEAIARTFFASKPVQTPEFLNTLNARNSLWRAKHYAKFDNMTLWDIKTRWLSLKSLRIDDVPNGDADKENIKDVPDAFDARKEWPDCIHPIRDQGRCGSCWAFGASESVSDRFCIASSGSTNLVFSPQYEVSCDTSNLGCNGGYLTRAWSFLEKKGIVTESCWPYKSGDGKVPKCSTFTSCEDGQPIKNYFIKKSSTKSYTKPASIKAEIYENGPIETGFSVYQDFMSYSGGIYEHESGGLLGGHAVKIIGWGVEGGIKYWIAANSWDNDWGESGFFRIREGECGFDKQGIAGLPDLDKI